jgi:hypothetical protein
MDFESQELKINRPPNELEQLQVRVRHLVGVWPAVLQRREILRRMAQSEVLREALFDTYAGHVFNAMHGALSGDLIRGIFAYILDRDRRSASVRQAITALRRAPVIAQLRTHVYGMVPRTPSQDSATAAAIDHLHDTDFTSIITGLPAELQEILEIVIDAPMAKVVEEVRNKLIAHAAIEHDGKNWKAWTIGGTKLTYSQLDDYIDECTNAVDKLSHRVLRFVYPFDNQPEVDQRYADEYIDALVKGLTQQKQERERKRQENLQQTQALFADDKH